MATIIVEKNNQKSFQSVCNIINSKILRDSDLFGGKGLSTNGTDTIVDGEDTYKLHLGGNGNSQSQATIKKSGASWFAGVRGEPIAINNDTLWWQFVEKIATEYHRQYPLIDYIRKPLTDAEYSREKEQYRRYIANILHFTCPSFPDTYEIAENKEAYEEEVYGVSLRLELSGGTGSGVPILCKVYFKRQFDELVPISCDMAHSLQQSLNNVALDDNNSSGVETDSEMIDSTLTALSKLVKSDGNKFFQSICASADDEETVNYLCEHLGQNVTVIECVRVLVKEISHISWKTNEYVVIMDDKPMFAFSAGLGGGISAHCVRCNDRETILESNLIYYTTMDGARKSVRIDPSRSDLGLNGDIANMVRTTSFAKHFIKITCPENFRNSRCARYICREFLSEMKNSRGKAVYKCADCPYPEIVYTNLYGEKFYTPALALARGDVMDLKPVADLQRCSLCGRYFEQVDGNKRCSLCAKLISLNGADSDARKARKVFRTYSSAFSPLKRFFTLANARYGVEDDEVVLLRIGAHVYCINKLTLNESGYIEKPRKLK